MAQGIVENDRAVRRQLVEINSCVWSGKERKSPPKTVRCPKLSFFKEEQQRLNTLAQIDLTKRNKPLTKSKQADNNNKLWRREPVGRVTTIYYLKYSVSNKKLQDIQRNKKVWPIHWGEIKEASQTACESKMWVLTEKYINSNYKYAHRMKRKYD